MCGIIGYIGNRMAASVILDGLKKLEYRGYDSAGIAVNDGRGLSIHKEKGKIAQLISTLYDTIPMGSIGVGHTRWATHGEPSQLNAHPHLDCQGKVAIVHNGIIENYQSLKNKLQLNGHRFSSDTDSEVIAHLIEDYLERENDFSKAVRLALKELKGTYALAAIFKEYPQTLVAARNGSPLIIGLGEEENFVASDIPALLKYTKKIMVLGDYQVAEVTPHELKVTDLEGRICALDTREVDWSIDEAEKKDFPHFMLKEIYEQPRVLRKLLNHYVDWNNSEIRFDEVFSSLGISNKRIKKIEKIIIQACGTSFHAGLLGRYLLNLFSEVSCDVQISSEFRYGHLITNKDTLVLSITQSGETTDALMGLREAKLHNLKTLSICNVVGSTIARESDAVIYTHAGPEIGVASTKSYTAQILVFYLLAIYLGSIKGLIAPHMKEKLLLSLKRVPDLMENIIEGKKQILECADKYYRTRDFLFLGRGLNYPNALEGALKLKEIAYVHASGHPAGEMKHGPIALIDKDVCAVFIAPDGSLYEKMVSNIEEVKARKGNIIVIATEGNTEIKKHCDEVFYIPKVGEYFYPLLIALPLQLFAYFVALNRGCEIDQPRNLAKSVTVE